MGKVSVICPFASGHFGTAVREPGWGVGAKGTIMGEGWVGSTHPSWVLGQEQDKAFNSSELFNFSLGVGGGETDDATGGRSGREAHFALRWEIQEVSELANRQGVDTEDGPSLGTRSWHRPG